MPVRAYVCLCVYRFASAAKSTRGGSKPPLAEVREPYLSEQVARLKSIKRLMLAMQVAVVLKDELLIEEGAILSYQLLGPLLAVKDKSPMVHQALAHVYQSLQVGSCALESAYRVNRVVP